MGILKAVGDFLFGKNPEIFDINGNVSHKHPEKKWNNWKNKYKSDPNLNWRHHSGMQAGSQPGNQRPTQKPSV